MLGRKLFCVCTQPLGEIMRRHDFEFHLYVEESQLQFTFNPGTPQSAHDVMERCIAIVRLWMAMNFLKLDGSKTEFAVVGAK